MEIILIRHGKTMGNAENRYIGTTDEPLCEEGKKELRSQEYPEVEMVFVSPLKRCLETAKLIYPHKNSQIISELRECDFGDFENKNYTELTGDKDYQEWIDSNGSLPFPKGESREVFQSRCLEGFQKAIDNGIKERKERIAFVIHGGTIMSIMEVYAYPKKDYFHWKVKNGQGFIAQLNKEEWVRGQKIFTKITPLFHSENL